MEYRALCSKKRTGFSSRMAAFNNRLASLGVDGATIFRPGTPRNHEIGTCECMGPNPTPPPTAERTTKGMLFCSFERYQYFADWLIRLSIARKRKSANIISAIGRMPATALPKAADAIASSEMGVSKTRSSPYLSRKPGVAANTPPASATSSPKKMTFSSAANSSSIASLIAPRNVSSSFVTLMMLCHLLF